jgi:hypothetical protein
MLDRPGVTYTSFGPAIPKCSRRALSLRCWLVGIRLPRLVAVTVRVFEKSIWVGFFLVTALAWTFWNIMQAVDSYTYAIYRESVQFY